MPDDPRENTPSADPFADVLAEILQAEEQGQAPDLERLVTDLPDLESRLRAYFRDREGFRAWPRSWRLTPGRHWARAIRPRRTTLPPARPPRCSRECGSAATRSWRSWAAAAWAWCTRRVSSRRNGWWR